MHRALALAALLALAGCGAPAAPGPASTATPAPVPEETPAPFPPGVDERGVYDPGRLVDAHAAVLANASYTVRVTSVHSRPGGELRSRYARVIRLSAGEERVHYVLNKTDRRNGTTDVRHIERYNDGDRLFVAVSEGNETTYRVREVARSRSFLAASTGDRQGFGRLLGRLRPALTDIRTENGTTRYRLASGPTDVRPLRNVTFDALVDRRGVVREYNITYTVRRDGAPVRVRVDVAFTDVGSTTVRRPDWVDRALAEVDRASDD